MRAFAWLALAATLQLSFHPLLLQQEAGHGEEYVAWMLDRGLDPADTELADALERAAEGSHRSIEGFVHEFVRIAEHGGVLEAMAADLAPGRAEVTPDELAELILWDLRSLAPKEPQATARLTSGDRAGLVLASRYVAGARDAADAAYWTDTPSPRPAPAVSRTSGLQTSIQALGP